MKKWTDRKLNIEIKKELSLLEKELLLQNVEIISKNDSLLLNEYEKQKELDTDILKRVGLSSTINQGFKLDNKIKLNELQLEKFDKTKIFNIRQIEKICDKYYLKFLPTELYQGTIDKDLPSKITEFETTYNMRCDFRDAFILAPKSSFKLEEKPKDPLFFYKINEENYYLIHKWGDDLNIFNRIKSFFSKPISTILILILSNLLFNFIKNLDKQFMTYIVFNVIFLVLNFFKFVEDGVLLTLYKKNNPFSSFKND
jgi:hypothetical protein